MHVTSLTKQPCDHANKNNALKFASSTFIRQLLFDIVAVHREGEGGVSAFRWTCLPVYANIRELKHKSANEAAYVGHVFQRGFKKVQQSYRELLYRHFTTWVII